MHDVDSAETQGRVQKHKAEHQVVALHGQPRFINGHATRGGVACNSNLSGSDSDLVLGI